MSAAEKALAALEAALKASARRIDLRKYPHANDDFRLEALSVNLSSPLAAVARAAMAWRKAAYYVKAESETASKLGLWQAESLEVNTRLKLFAALDALEAAAEAAFAAKGNP